MLRFFAFLVCLSVSLPAFSDNGVLETLSERISASLADFDFSYTVSKTGSPDVTGEGSMRMQDDDYVIVQGTLEVRCHDGEIWTVDRDAMEVVIESGENPSSGFIANPSVFLKSFADIFECVSSGKGTFAGSACLCFGLKPKAEDSGMDSVDLYISPDGQSVTGMVMKLTDGTSARFVISNFRLSGKTDPSSFSTDLSSFGSDYIVTDLR